VAIRAVLDTNIWVSAILNPVGFPAEILKSFRQGDFLAVISEPIISEIADVLSRPRIKNKYGITEADILELLRSAATRKTTASLKQLSKVMQRTSSPGMMISNSTRASKRFSPKTTLHRYQPRGF
jgi:putative PIN family toxin of toxin-antitoxin system